MASGRSMGHFKMVDCAELSWNDMSHARIHDGRDVRNGRRETPLATGPVSSDRDPARSWRPRNRLWYKKLGGIAFAGMPLASHRAPCAGNVGVLSQGVPAPPVPEGPRRCARRGPGFSLATRLFERRSMRSRDVRAHRRPSRGVGTRVPGTISRAILPQNGRIRLRGWGPCATR